MKGWVGLAGWPIADGLPTLVVTHQLQVERRTGKVRRPETDVLPLCHATNQHDRTLRDILERRIKGRKKYFDEWYILSLWFSLHKHRRIHNQMPVFSRGFLLPCVQRTNMQQSQIQFNGSEPGVVGSSWTSFPAWRLANCSSSSDILVKIYKMVKWETEDETK